MSIFNCIVIIYVHVNIRCSSGRRVSPPHRHAAAPGGGNRASPRAPSAVAGQPDRTRTAARAGSRFLAVFSIIILVCMYVRMYANIYVCMYI